VSTSDAFNDEVFTTTRHDSDNCPISSSIGNEEEELSPSHNQQQSDCDDDIIIIDKDDTCELTFPNDTTSNMHTPTVWRRIKLSLRKEKKTIKSPYQQTSLDVNANT